MEEKNEEKKTVKEKEVDLRPYSYFRIGLPSFDQEVNEKINAKIFTVLAEVGQEYPNITIKHKVASENENSWIKIY